MQAFKTLAVTAVLLAGAAGAQAALINRGNGMIYDTTLDVTWLSDMKYAQTSQYDADGLMDWHASLAWADQLSHGGYSDWRLATQDELVSLFTTDLGNQSDTAVLDQVGDSLEQQQNLALFSNVQSYAYWSGQELAPYTNEALVFNAGSGRPNSFGTDAMLYALAVRSGDVAASVPEPQTLALLMTAFGAAVVARRKRPA